MNRSFQRDAQPLPKGRKGRYLRRKWMISLVLFLSISSMVGLSAWNTRKAEAAPSGEVYPAPTTLYTVPVPTNVASNWSTPYAITVGPDKNLWFTDYFDNLIGQATPGGAITEYPLPSGHDPTAITAGPDGNLWFLERYGGAYGYITPSGAITAFPGGPYGADPESLVAGPDGNLWAADYGGGIARMTTAGAMTEFSSAGINPSTITVGPDGNLWYTAISVIGKMSTAGVGTSFPLNGGYAFPGGITAGPDGNLWFTEQGTSQDAIARITPTGVITDFPLPTVTFPDHTTLPVQANDLVTGPDGNLWFTANSAPLFGQITPSGTITYYLPANASSFGGTSPNSLVAGPDGNLWFADFAGHVGYLALGGSSPTPTPVPQTPTPTSSPTGPSLEEYLQASDAAYGLDTGQFVLPAGMEELQRASDLLHGFEAVALLDSQKNIIIANEGSLQLKGTPNGYTETSADADMKVWRDNASVPALADAITFAGEIVRKYYGLPGYGEIYVTGHSLGGIEAEAEAKAWANIAGGATFGATGLPHNTMAGGPVGLINYVEYGDPVGNYASDPENALYDQTPGLMYHYGQVKMIGSQQAALDLRKGVTIEDLVLDLPPDVPDSSARKAFGADILELTALAVVGSNVPDHFLDKYASDLVGVPIPVLGFDAAGEAALMYDLELDTLGFKNLDTTTVQPNGTLNSPDFKVTYNIFTGQMTFISTKSIQDTFGKLASGTTTLFFDHTSGLVTQEKYVASDGTVYLTTLNAKGAVASIAVNLHTGGSYLTTYDTTGTQPWSNVTNFYKKPDEKGTLTETLFNWATSGSQVVLFTGLPHGYKKELKNYSGPNGTGTLLSIQYQ